jgi:hypothetical protein
MSEQGGLRLRGLWRVEVNLGNPIGGAGSPKGNWRVEVDVRNGNMDLIPLDDTASSYAKRLQATSGEAEGNT